MRPQGRGPVSFTSQVVNLSLGCQLDWQLMLKRPEFVLSAF